MISIVLSARNEEKYIHECIASIINQSFKDWELIAVDNNSIDKTLQILQGYQENDSRINVYTNQSGNLLDALALSYSKVSGDIVTRMDADDVMPANKLKDLVGLLQKVGKGNIVTGKVKYISENELGDGFTRYENWMNTMVEEASWLRYLYADCPIASPNWIMYKEDLDSIGGLITGEIPEDYDMAFRIARSGIKINGVGTITHIWRDHPGRNSRVDDNYDLLSYLPFKVNNYLKTSRDDSKRLALWGVGKRGKLMAQQLIEEGAEFIWVTDNPKKIGKDIYGKIIKPSIVLEDGGFQAMVSVSNPFEKEEVGLLCREYGVDYWSFG